MLGRAEAAALLSNLPPVLLECVLECLGDDARDDIMDALAVISKTQVARRGSLQRWGAPAFPPCDGRVHICRCGCHAYLCCPLQRQRLLHWVPSDVVYACMHNQYAGAC